MKKLLLVDDSRAVRLAARRIIAPLGFDLYDAEDGADALRVIREQGDIEAVLLDWNMPVMDGLTFLKTLRSSSDIVQPKVVMCTTENDLPKIVEAISAGANEYIMKPFTEEIVREKLAGAGII
jgi:two-component system, chemotaxis family, chemotaxis protein CheY